MKKFSSYSDFVNHSLEGGNIFRSFGTCLGMLLCMLLSPLYVVFVALKFVVISFITDFYDGDVVDEKGVAD